MYKSRKYCSQYALIITVSFYKRAQILIADIWSCFEGKSYGEFNDINTITMFADYRYIIHTEWKLFTSLL